MNLLFNWKFYSIFVEIIHIHKNHPGFPGGSEVKASAYNAGDLGSIPGSGRSPGEGHGNPLQYSCLENPMDSGAWWATVHRVTKSWTQLSARAKLLQIIGSIKERSIKGGVLAKMSCAVRVGARSFH